MSREVDQRVVEMQFDNAQFERNTKQSLNTIEKLKAALKFDKAGESLSGISKAAKSLDLTPVSNGVDEVTYRFKALDVVAATVISNITSKVTGLGVSLAKALYIDPVKSGLSEYETQINSVQTILANTQSAGTTIEQVNAALDELNRYADMTIYNFTEMTRNIGTFTAAGVDLDTSVQAIKGIANLAAISGSTSMQASTAMYQLSQALAAGTVKLMDWNSVVNAGMGGAVFQDALKETARVHGIAIDEMIAKEGSFRETLQHGWLSASILTETLAKFTGDLSEEELKAIGYTNEQIKAIMEMGETANDAATKVKTFTQLIDTLKEAIQSGWTQSWEYIIGDFEEAKELWTELSDRFSSIVNESAEARNELLKGGLASGFKQFIEEGVSDSSGMLIDMLAAIGKAQGAITDEEIEAAGGLQKTFEKGWLTADILEGSLLQVIKEAQTLSELSDDELAKRNLSKEKIDEILKSFTELETKIQNGNLSVDEFVEKINRPSGRENLFQSLLNVMDAIGKVFGSIKGAFDEIFPPMTADTLYNVTVRIREFTENLMISDDTTEKLKSTFKGFFGVIKIGVNIFTALAKSVIGFTEIILNSGTVQAFASGVLSVTSIFGDFVSSVAEATSGVQGIGDIFDYAAEKADNLRNIFNSLMEKLNLKFSIPSFDSIIDTLGIFKNSNISKNAISSVSDLFAAISSGDFSIGDKAKVAAGAVFATVSTAIKNLIALTPDAIEFFVTLPEKALEGFNEFSKSVTEGLTKAKEAVSSALEPFEDFFDVLKTEFNALTGTDIYRFLSLVDIGLLSAAIVSLGKVAKTLSNVVKNPIEKFTDSASEMFESIGSAANAWKKKQTIQSIQYIAVAMVGLAGAFYIFSKIDQSTIMTTVGAIAATMGVLTVSLVALRKVLKQVPATRLVGLATVMVSVGGSIAILSDSLVSLTSVLKPYGSQSLGENIAAFGTVMIGLTTLLISVGTLANIANGTSFGSLLGLAVFLAGFGKSIEMIVDAVSVLMSLVQMDLDATEQAVTGIFKIMAAVFVGTAAMSKISISSGIGMAAFALTVKAMASAVSSLGELASIDFSAADAAVSGMFKLILGLSILSVATSAITASSGLALIGMATSLLILSSAIKSFSKIGIAKFASGLLKVASGLLVLTTSAIFLSTSQAGVLGASAAMVVMTASLTMLAGVVERFAEIPFAQMVQSLVSFAVVLGGMSASLVLLSTFSVSLSAVSGAILSIAAAMAILSASVALLGSIDFGKIVSGLVGVVGILAVLVGAGALVTYIPGLSVGLGVLAAALSSLSAVFLSFAAAAASLALASAALGVLAMFAGPICQAIVGAAPDIGDALVALITMLCNVISQTIDPILDTLGAVLIAVGEHLFAAIGGLWVYIEPALTSLLDKGKQWIWDHTLGHDWFGIGAMFSDMSAVWRGDAEAAGQYIAQGYAKAFDEDETAGDAIESLGARILFTFRRFFDIASPSKVTEQDGKYVAQGIGVGIREETPEVVSATENLASSIEQSLLAADLYGMGNHYGLQFAEGLAAGIQGGNGKASGLAELWTSGAPIDKNKIKNEFKDYIGLGTNSLSGALDPLKSAFDNTVGKLLSDLGIGDTGIVADAATKAADDFAKTVNNATSSGSSKGSNKKEKTPAELVEEKYKDQLELNKTLMDIADQEYSNWMTENQNGVSTDEIIAKKLEHNTDAIALQTKRLEIAQAKYDDMVKAVGADSQEAKEAELDLIKEKGELAELKSSQYADIYEEAIKRLETESDTLSKEYELWTDQNLGASDLTKNNKEIEKITKELSNSAEQLTYAQQQYQLLLEAYGESDLRTQEAYNNWLDTQIEQQEKQNELREAQLEQFDIALNAIERESSLLSSHQDILSKLYDDGDLSTRFDDYIAAVEKYGADSQEARRARYQGSANGVLGVAVALRNMSDELKKTRVYRAKYNELLQDETATTEELAQAQEDVLSSQSNFLDFASNLADAFNMSDQGKEITVRLAYSISENWDTIYGGFKQAWGKMEERFPELTSSMEKIFGDAFSDTGISLSTSLVSTITSFLSGDYGSALASGLNTFITFIGSDMGQNLLSSLTNAFATGLPEIGSMITSFFGSSGVLGEIGASLTGVVSTIAGEGGLAGIFTSLTGSLTGVAALIPELLPFIAIGAAIIGVISFLVSNWDNLGDIFNNLVDTFIDFGSNLVNAIGEGITKAWKGFTDFVGGIFNGFIDFVKGIFGIHSPSTVFVGIGQNLDQGFADGITKGASNVSNSLSEMTNTAIGIATDTANRFANLMSGNHDWDMSIQPITSSRLASNYSSSSSNIPITNREVVLNTRRSDELASSLNGVRNQNGKSDNDSSRADVVAAIDSLANRVVMMGESIENMQVVLDSKKLVGGIAGQMDSALGVRATRARRGG